MKGWKSLIFYFADCWRGMKKEIGKFLRTLMKQIDQSFFPKFIVSVLSQWRRIHNHKSWACVKKFFGENFSFIQKKSLWRRRGEREKLVASDCVTLLLRFNEVKAKRTSVNRLLSPNVSRADALSSTFESAVNFMLQDSINIFFFPSRSHRS